MADSNGGITKPDFTEEQAREHTERILLWADTGWELIAIAYQRRAWAALGYQTWDAYLQGEFKGVRLSLPREDRQQVVTSLREAGLSIRAIASATGASTQTIQNDLQPDPGVVNHHTSTPERVTGSDGKSYAPTRPAPARPAAFQSPFTPQSGPDPESEPPSRPAQQPSPAVTEWVGSSQTVQDAQYIAEFAKALCRYDDFAEFDADRVGRLADETTMTSLEHLVTTANGFLERARRARRSLRVVGK